MTTILSTRPQNGSDLLCGGPKSLLAQADAAAGRFQDDGWGIGFFNGEPVVRKSPRPARLEKKKFSAAAGARSGLVIGHLRDASNPAGLPRASLLGRANTQPFAAGGCLFAHNGTLFIKDEIRSLLGKYAAKVRGDNDSEVLFWQVMKMLDAYGSPETALEMALDEIRTVWLSCRGKYPGRPAPYRGLNMFLASPGALTVLCHYQSRKEGGKGALLTPGWEYGRIAWRREKSRLVFSSEPADGGPGWRKMNDPEIASASVKAGRLEVSFKRIKL